jgi:hypothetical protein
VLQEIVNANWHCCLVITGLILFDVDFHTLLLVVTIRWLESFPDRFTKQRVMRFISYTAICIGFILAAAAEGFCVGLLLSSVIVGILILRGEDSIGLGLLIGIMAVLCAFMSALFQFPLLWNKVRPDLPN